MRKEKLIQNKGEKMGKVRNKGISWDTDDYNERLSKENDILDEMDEKRNKLNEEERKRIKGVWIE